MRRLKTCRQNWKMPSTAFNKKKSNYRRIQIITETTATGDVNQVIAKFNEQLETTTATIAKLTAEKATLVQQNNEKAELINELKTIDLSTTTTGSNPKRPRQHSDDLQGFVNNETLLETMKDLNTQIALSIKTIEEKQRELENKPQAPDNPALINIIQQELAPFNHLLNTLSTNQQKLQDSIQTIKIAATPRPISVRDNFPNTPTNNAYDVAARQRPAVTPIPLSYAQAVAKSTIPADVIRNVTLNGSPEHIELIANKLKRDKLSDDVQLASVKTKGKHNFTFKCKDADAAAKVEEQLKNKYSDDITITKVQPAKNQVKITKIFADTTDAADLLEQIILQNSWMNNLGTAPDRLYTIQTPKGQYMNLIINCDIQSHTELLRRSNIVYGFSECKIFEYVNTLQCLNCQRYGHFARECKFATCCKFCAQGHNATQCNLQSTKYTCHNCVLSNKRNTIKVNVKHVATDDRCPARIERLEALKHVILAKN